MVTLNTTWQEMLDDKYVYDEALIFIYKNSIVQDLVNRKILKQRTKYIIEKNYIFDVGANTEAIIYNIIVKLSNIKHVYFSAAANEITVKDLIAYVCAILSKFIMIDKLVSHLWIFNYQLNNFTFSTTFFKHNPVINIKTEGIGDSLTFKYNLSDNKNNKYYDGFFTVKIAAEDYEIFDLDCSKKNLPIADFIKLNLPKVGFHIIADYYNNSSGNTIKVFKKWVDIAELVKEIKSGLGESIKLI